MRNSFYKDRVLEGAKKWNLQIILIFFVITIGVLIYVTNQRHFFINETFITSEAPKREFCTAVMSQMIAKKLSPKLLDEGLYDLVTRDNYGALYLSGKESILGIWSTDNSCKVLFREEHLRGFDLFLEDSAEYPFYYKVTKITEHDFFEKEEN